MYIYPIEHFFDLISLMNKYVRRVFQNELKYACTGPRFHFG